MATPNVAIRLGTTGRAEVVADLDAIGTAGEASAKRTANAYNRAADDVARAQERMTSQRAKIEAVNLGSGGAGLPNESNVRPIELTAAAIERLRLRAQALVSAIDPAYAAQVRFDREMGEAQKLIAANAITLDQYAAKLRAETALLNETGGAHGRAAAGAGAQRAAMQNLSYQAQDTFTQLSMGANVFQVVAVQGGQAAGAFANVGGAAGKVASFMIGPWGLAITAGLLVLGPLVDGLFKMNSELDKAVDQLKKDAAQTDLTARAKEVYRGTLEGLKQAIRDNDEATKRSIDGQKTSAQLSYDQAKATLAKTEKTRADTQVTLENARAYLVAQIAAASGPSQRSEVAALGIDRYQQELAKVQALLDGKNAKAASDQLRVSRTLAELTAEQAKLGADAVGTINKKYDEQINTLINAAGAQRKLTEAARATLRAQLDAIEVKRKAEIKAEQDRERDAKRTGTRDSDTLTSTQVAKFLRSQLPGVHVTATTNGKHVDGSDHYKDGAIDFVPAGGMGSMSKAQVRELFVRAGIEIRVNGKGVEQLFGPGDKGHSDHFHVAWVKGKNELAEYNDEQKRAKDLERERAQGLAELRKMFDPAAEAAENYRLTLAKIAALKLDPATAARYAEGAHDAFVKANAAAFTMPDLELYRDQQPDFAGIERDGKRAKDAIEDTKASLAYAREELRLAGAGADLRDRELNKLSLILRVKRDFPLATQDDIDALVRLNEQLDRTSAEAKVRAAGIAELRGAADQLVDTLFNPDNWNNFGELGKSVLRQITQELLKLALLNPIKNWIGGSNDNPTLGSIFGGGGGGGGGGFGDIVKGFLSILGGHNASGTQYFGGGPTWVGENGPELIFAPTGSKIASADASRRAALQGGQGINLTYAPVIQAPNADGAGLEQVRQQMMQDKKDFAARVVSTVNSARERGFLR